PTTIVDMGATRLTGDATENRSTIPPPSNISYHTSNLDETSSGSLLQPPVLLKGNSFESERAISNNLHYSYNHPQSNPHQLFLNRSEETGRNHLVEGTEDVKQWLDGGEQHSNQLGNQSSSRSSQDNRSHYYANNVTSTNITILFDSKPPYLFSKY
ncbi:unnamed protein product, partial [Rotaria sp. Silwood2]